RGTKGTDQRQEELRADSRITAIEPHQVLCGVCDQWIKLQSYKEYDDESTSEERRAELERDGRCENVEPQHVTCKLCNRTVGLHVKKDYSLSNWYRHISSCGKKIDK
ncbi:uncharacterized protein FOMMEDRAFT_77932, partial [Fomitiporia mediterranea MF3/22]|uniref:uncharacterized protein n=1 Tax=Fomitiporia mediterranea (strain MF3/22) TaxID=694068 RepID=UPI0004408A66